MSMMSLVLGHIPRPNGEKQRTKNSFKNCILIQNLNDFHSFSE